MRREPDDERAEPCDPLPKDGEGRTVIPTQAEILAACDRVTQALQAHRRAAMADTFNLVRR